MIDKAEIESKAKEFEIHPTNVEKDYVFGWVLFGIFSVSSLKDIIFLKGGNALRKGYFEHTRFSSDLDFGIPNDINQEALLNELNKICDFVQEKTGVVFVKEDNKVKEKFTASEAPIPNLRVYEARIYFKDFQGKSDHLKLKVAMDITRFDKVLLPLQTIPLIHPYSDAQEVACNIRCMKLEEIIATKLKCLLQRQHAPDLFDYVHTIKLLGGTINKDEIVQTFVKKTIFNKNPHIVKDILVNTPFDYFRNFWSKTIVCAKTLIFKVEEAIAFFVADLESLFSIYSNNGYARFAYFGPEFRVAIMEAGRSQTLLKIRYNGSNRIIEPYALKYLERKDGNQREYFYVYNRSGGSNAPGVRSLVAENIESIENTEEKFEPQFPIELSKAGELPENPYMFDPNRPVPAPKRKTKYTISIKYVYQCGFCGKRFTKTKMNSELGPHKNKNGYQCNSRRGIYITTKY